MARSPESRSLDAAPVWGQRATNTKLARLEARALRTVPAHESMFVTHSRVLMTLWCQLPAAAQAQFSDLDFLQGRVVHGMEPSPRRELIYPGCTKRSAVRCIRKTLKTGANFGSLMQGSTTTACVSVAAVRELVEPLPSAWPSN